MQPAKKLNEMNDTEKQNYAIDNCVKLVNEYVVKRKDVVSEFLNEFGTRYFQAPASSKLEHHSAFVGGLAYHSYFVTQRMLNLSEALGAGLSPESIVIVGLFHDVGKCGSVDGVPYYIAETSKWHRDNLGNMFKYNKDLEDSFEVPTRSVRILQHFGIDLSDSEYGAILYHDGLFVESNRHRSHMFSKDKLIRITHMADAWVCMIEGT